MLIPLDVQSAYTLLQSPMSLARYIQTAKEQGYTALGLADVNVLYGALDFYSLCKQADIQPLIGMAVQLPLGDSLASHEEWLIYAKNYAGYQDLMALSSLLQMTETVDAKAAQDYMFTHNQNWLTILPARNGPHMRYLKQGRLNEAMAWLENMGGHFSQGQILLGIGSQNDELFHLQSLITLAKAAQVEIVPLPRVRYCHSEDAFSLEILHAIEQNRPIEDVASLTNMAGFDYLRSPAAYQAIYTQISLPAANPLTSFKEIAANCQVEMPVHQYLLPKFPVPGNIEAHDYLRQLAREGLSSRLTKVSMDYHQRLDYELGVIHSMGFDDYFLIVWDVMRYAHEKKIMTGPGRGSAAGSLVAYSLRITDVDPVANSLLFERFLNPERKNMPDIDLDFPDDQRYRILEYVHKKYGTGHVAQIATFGTFAARVSLRNVGAVLGKSQEVINEWANSIPKNASVTLETAYEQSSDFRQLVQREANGDLWFNTAKRIEGLPRHISTHAAGVIISDQPLHHYLPLKANSGRIPLSQYTMDKVEAIGLLKFDFLSLINLTILHDAVAAAEKLAGYALPPSAYDLDDHNVFALFQRADTSGVFQFESDGIRHVLKQVSPASMEDLAAVNALFRPGPMKQIKHFVARKNGLEPITYPHPDLAPILRPTYGVMIYQEQVMQVANRLAGFSYGQADILRRAMSKKSKNSIDKLREKFISGAKQQGYTIEKAEQVYDYIDEFANYGFNRSHAFAYSYLAYQLAWLKTYYPAAFFYGNLINGHIHDAKGKQLVAEAKNRGIEIMPPDVNASLMNMRVIDADHIQLGLHDIKGLARNAAELIIQERQAAGRYKDLSDFINRLNSQIIKIDILEKLAKANALAAFGYNRRTLIEDALPKVLEHAKLFSSDDSNQLTLLSDDEQQFNEIFAPVISRQPEFSKRELIEGEIETLGQALTVKLYEAYQPFYLANLITSTSQLLPDFKAAIIGEITHLRRISTKNGKPMAFLKVQDEAGLVEVTVFPADYVQYAALLHEGQQIYLYGKVQFRNESLQMVLLSARSLNDDLIAFLNKQLHKNDQPKNSAAFYIQVANRQEATAKKTEMLRIIAANPGVIPIHFSLSAEKEQFWLADKFNTSSTPAVIAALQNLYGAENIKMGSVNFS